VKKRCTPFVIFPILLLLVLHVYADNSTMTNTTTVPAAANTTLATVPVYPVNTTATPVFANTTSLPATTNSSVPLETTVAAPTAAAGAPSTGNLSVASSPPGADILIDGVLYGSTPGNVTDISAGNHIIRLALSGYYDYEGTVYVVPGQMTSVFGTLPPLNGDRSSSTAEQSPAQTAAPAAVVTVQTTTASSGDMLSNPTILAALIGIVTACIGAFAAMFPHLSKSKK